jgi:hypothetical protein
MTRCEVADDPVVVKKLRPEKPGNRVEEKTAMTSGRALPVKRGSDDYGRAKSLSAGAKGRSFKES